MQKKEQTDLPVDEVIERIAAALGAESPEDWMGVLGVAPETVRTWRKRGAVPAGKLLRVAQVSGRSVESLTKRGVFFDRTEKQVIQKTAVKDLDLMVEVMAVVLEELERADLSLPPRKISELVRLIYEHEAAEASTVEQKGIRTTAARYLRLVA
jgi:Bacteriophage CI repressor helix-turn-helix domain